MDGREQRVLVFEDSQRMIKESKKLQDSIKKSTEKQLIIKTIEKPRAEKKYETKITVTKRGTMEAGKEWSSKGNTAVLNFASATTPGGGVVKGASAQEECLCRVSTLYNCLNDDKRNWDNFYNPNREEANVLHNDWIIYTPKVCVFKSDDYKTFAENEYFYVDVITCAAPNLRDVPNNGWCNIGESNNAVKITDEKMYDIHYNRAKAILNSAVSHNIKNIVLGAFGCGAFRNKPEIVAKAYKDVLKEYDGLFENIEFAVYCKQYETQNYDIFNKVLVED